MAEVISVRFSEKGKAYYFDPRDLAIEKSEHVIVETSKGIEYGECVEGRHEVPESAVVPPLRPVVRIATEQDKKIAKEGKAREQEAFEYCQKRIADYGLEMKLVSVEYGFDGNKILFFFTSDGRVDFRELVKDLAGSFKSRIELRQIGVRDEARMLGGLGICGKQFCCSSFLNEFHPVSIKMAKTQGLSLNPSKISGICGRLMCCLKYEEAAYEDLVRRAPRIDAFVETPSGKGSVTNVNLLRGKVKVRLTDGVDTTLKTFTFDELDVLGGKARKAEYIVAKAEGRLEEAGFKPSPPPSPPPPPVFQETPRKTISEQEPAKKDKPGRQKQQRGKYNQKRKTQQNSNSETTPKQTTPKPFPAKFNKSTKPNPQRQKPQQDQKRQDPAAPPKQQKKPQNRRRKTPPAP